MSIHLTDSELRDFASGALAPGDLLRADNHLAGCAQCQRRALQLRGSPEPIRLFRASLNVQPIHLAEEELQLAALGRLSEEGHQTAAQHLKYCEMCAGDVQDLRSWVNPAPYLRAPIPWLRFAAAAAIAVFLLAAGIWFVLAGREPQTESLAGIQQLPLPLRERVRQALQSGRASVPEFLGQVGSREVQMGSKLEHRVAPQLKEPVATGVVSDRPEFRWGPVAGANAYMVSIFDEKSRVIARSPALAQLSWVPSAPLPRGETYVWQVSAFRGKQTVTSPAPPDPPAEFHIIDSDAADALHRAELQHPDSHLLLGILYAEAGIRSAAITHLRLVRPQDQHKDVARHTLNLLTAVN